MSPGHSPVYSIFTTKPMKSLLFRSIKGLAVIFFKCQTEQNQNNLLTVFYKCWLWKHELILMRLIIKGNNLSIAQISCVFSMFPLKETQGEHTQLSQGMWEYTKHTHAHTLKHWPTISVDWLCCKPHTLTHGVNSLPGSPTALLLRLHNNKVQPSAAHLHK